MCTLLAESGHDEQRVVDPDRQTGHRDHVRDDKREMEESPRQCHHTKGDAYVKDAEDDWDRRRHHRTEYEKQDQQSDSDADQLTLLQVFLSDLREVFANGCLARLQDAETRRRVALERDVVELCDVLRRLIDGSGHRHRQKGRMTITRGKVNARALIDIRHRQHDVWAEQVDPVTQRLDEGSIVAVLHGQRRGLDDHHL